VFNSSDKGAWIYKACGVTLSVVVGLLSTLAYPLSGLLALVGVGLGVYWLLKAKRSPVNYGGGSAKLLILGSVVAFLVFAAIAAPSVLTTRSAVNETSAVRSLIAILDAQRTNSTKTGRPGTLAELAAAGLIDTKLAGGTKDGYQFSLRLNGDRFEAFAVPISYGAIFGTGRRSFYADDSGNIYEGDKNGGEASSDDGLIT
jgi:hypothetical protein